MLPPRHLGPTRWRRCTHSLRLGHKPYADNSLDRHAITCPSPQILSAEYREVSRPLNDPKLSPTKKKSHKSYNGQPEHHTKDGITAQNSLEKRKTKTKNKTNKGNSHSSYKTQNLKFFNYKQVSQELKQNQSWVQQSSGCNRIPRCR